MTNKGQNHLMQQLVDQVVSSSYGYRFLRGAFHFGVRKEPIRRALQLTSGDSILDVGCGTGTNMRLLSVAGHEVAGITLSKAEAKVVQEQGFTCQVWDKVPSGIL